ncbi:hypothetical protein Gotri_024327 [Gossypium trilobum]|uniref:Uncharacterized protein n=1 Tax=Gossypium trilobum TaxID=34281 RepID=A0A7J9DLW9_9ROSI|nr:hypothetical protein [Gossypium trilobum]
MKEVHAIPICYCGFSAPLRTLWSNSNPGLIIQRVLVQELS